MAKRVNSASRLYDVLSAAAQQNERAAGVDAWAVALAIAESTPREKAIKVTERLGLLNEQLRAVAEQMRQANFSEVLYKADVHRIGESLNPLLLPAAWKAARDHLTERTLYALTMWSEVLADEEEAIEASTMAQLIAEVESLESALETAKVPDSLRTVIRAHLRAIREAISSYKVVGARALREAATDAVVDIVRHQEEFKQSSNEESVGRFGRLVQRVGTLADSVVKIGEVIEYGKRLIELIANILPPGGGGSLPPTLGV